MARVYGMLKCADCGASVVKTSSNMRRCGSCAAAAYKAYRSAYAQRQDVRERVRDLKRKPEYVAKQKEYMANRWRTCKEYRDAARARKRTDAYRKKQYILQAAPEYRRQFNSRRRSRYSEDPQYRAKVIEKTNSNYHSGRCAMKFFQGLAMSGAVMESAI